MYQSSHSKTIYYATKETAQFIRVALKRAFPSVKFSVRKDGNSINIGWMDGPQSNAVEKVARQYEAGRFDGMVDYAWNVTHWQLPDGSTIVADSEGTECQNSYTPAINNPAPHPEAQRVMFGARYVFCNREISRELKALALHQVKEKWGIVEPVSVVPCSYNPAQGSLSKDFHVENAGEWLATLVHREILTIAA